MLRSLAIRASLSTSSTGVGDAFHLGQLEADPLSFVVRYRAYGAFCRVFGSGRAHDGYEVISVVTKPLKIGCAEKPASITTRCLQVSRFSSRLPMTSSSVVTSWRLPSKISVLTSRPSVLTTAANTSHSASICWKTGVFLRNEELQKVMAAEVPDSLKETKDAFVLHCAIGFRIGDFQRMMMDNVSVSPDGIPYIHYLPQKTKTRQSDNHEIETPLMRFALDVIKRTEFNLPILRYPSGKSGYNKKIKKLLEAVGIDRKVAVFDEAAGENKYVPLYEVGSSKLARKTHVDLMNKVQVDLYAAGLHRQGSKAVLRYTMLELKDRFALMCAAFGEEQYKVDDRFEVVSV